MPEPSVLLSVVICTYRRAWLLSSALESCISQHNFGQYSYEILVIDNDPEQSASSVCRKLSGCVHNLLRYVFEPRTNISIARNRGVAEARGDFIAFIDDDNIVPKTWLDAVAALLRKYDADILFGDVLPLVLDSNSNRDIADFFLRRVRTVDGMVPVRKDGYIDGARTMNSVLRRAFCFPADEEWFDPDFGMTGGEDTEFFTRVGRRYPIVVSSSWASVYEIIPLERQDRRYLIQRGIREGRNYARAIIKNSDYKYAQSFILFLKGVSQVTYFSLCFFLCMLFRAKAGTRYEVLRSLAFGKSFSGVLSRGRGPYR